MRADARERRAASSTFSVPTTFAATNSRGCRYEYGIAISAPRWKTTSQPVDRAARPPRGRQVAA